MFKKAKGDLDGALADCEKTIKLDPGEPGGYLNRGLVMYAKGDLDGALADFNKAIELNPKNAWAYYTRGCLHYDTREFTTALGDFRKGCELDPSLDTPISVSGSSERASVKQNPPPANCGLIWTIVNWQTG